MSHHSHHAAHGLHKVGEIVSELPPLKTKKSPVLAGILGFLFGPFGIGAYFMSWKDFLCCMGMLILLMIAIPGLGALPGWIFSACYGVYRANKSNEHHVS